MELKKSLTVNLPRFHSTADAKCKHFQVGGVPAKTYELYEKHFFLFFLIKIG